MLLAGTDITLTTTLMSNGVNVTATSVQMQVSNSAGILQAFATLTPVSIAPGVLIFTVPAALNALTGSNTKEARIVDLLVGSGSISGTMAVRLSYVINATLEQLVVMTNSFQTYADAVLTADQMPDLVSWPTASYDDQLRSMAIAFRLISHLNFEIYYDRDDIYFKNRASWGLPYLNTIGNLYAYSATDFGALDPDFIAAVKLAQLAEADEQLGGNMALDDRELGVVNKVTGDNAITYRSVKPLKFSVSRRALRHLAGYVRYAPRTIRS